MVRFNGGSDAEIEGPLIIVKKKALKYQMCAVPDNVPRLRYWTGPKGWMDSTNMLKWLQNLHAHKDSTKKRFHDLCFDNFRRYNLMGDVSGAT